MLEKRKIYLEEIEDYANGFYIRDLLTKYGKVQDLKVPRVRNGGFRPAILVFTPKRFSVNKGDRR